MSPNTPTQTHTVHMSWLFVLCTVLSIKKKNLKKEWRDIMRTMKGINIINVINLLITFDCFSYKNVTLIWHYVANSGAQSDQNSSD